LLLDNCDEGDVDVNGIVVVKFPMKVDQYSTLNGDDGLYSHATQKVPDLDGSSDTSK
jgi:hypothetical protein